MPHGPLEGLQQAGQPTPTFSRTQRNTQRVFEGGIDALLGLVGVGPETKANLVGQLLPVGAVAGILPATARALSKSLLRTLQHSSVDSRVLEALQFAAERYPRVTGHVTRVGRVPEFLAPRPRGPGIVNRIKDTLSPRGAVGNQSMELTLGIPKLSELEFASPSEFDYIRGLGGRDPTSTVGHELTHVAQQIGRGARFEPEYVAQTRARGYVDNPFEISARQGGEKFRKAFEQWKRMKTPPYPPTLGLR